MQRLRAFIEHLRDELLGMAYPPAHARPWVGPGRHLFISAQEQAGLPPDLWAGVEPQTGVMLLLPRRRASSSVSSSTPKEPVSWSACGRADLTPA